MQGWGVVCLLLLSGCGENRAPVLHYGVEDGAGTLGAHSVLRGDTLYSISKRYKTSIQDIVITNRLTPPYRLNVGQRIQFPPPQNYRVRQGDALYTVSRQYGMSTMELARLNDLQAPYLLQPGQELRLPSQARVTAQREAYERQEAEAEVASRVIVSNGAAVEREVLEVPAVVKSGGGVPQPEAKPADGGSVVVARKPVAKKGVVKAKGVKKSTSSAVPKRSSSKFKKPIAGRVISGYGPKKGGLHNDGINIKAPRGTSVAAAENGVVVYSGNDLKGTGNLILVRHSDRWMSAYAHLENKLVKRGDVIKRGQQIGTVGSTGSVDSPQLHFELRRGTKALNPSVYLEG